MEEGRKKVFSVFYKNLILFLCLALAAGNDVTYSIEFSPTDGPESFAHLQISIPKELGTIEDSLIIQDKSVIYIQDAHDSLDAQKNIAKIIQYLVKNYGVEVVLEEGYEGPVPTDKYFGAIKDRQVRRRAAYFLMDKLRIGGAEYAHITRKKNFQLIGADSFNLHKKNIERYRQSARYRQDTERCLKIMDVEIRNLVQKHFTKDLKEWMRIKERLERKEIDLLDYLKRTQPLFIKALAHDAFQARYPTISMLLAADKTRDKAVLEKLKAVVDYRSLFTEINALEDDYAETHLKAERDREVFRYYKFIQLLGRLNALEITKEEYDAVKDRFAEIDTVKLAKFITDQTGKSILFSRAWERHIRSALGFYRVAGQRDSSIWDHLQQYRKGESNAPVVLVYGGFHKGRIRELLAESEMTYTIVVPKIDSIDPRHQAYYKQLMTDGRYPFELPTNLANSVRPESRMIVWDQHPNIARAELRVITDAVRFSRGFSEFNFRAERAMSALSRRITGGRSEVRSVQKDYDEKIGSITESKWEYLREDVQATFKKHGITEDVVALAQVGGPFAIDDGIGILRRALGKDFDRHWPNALALMKASGKEAVRTAGALYELGFKLQEKGTTLDAFLDGHWPGLLDIAITSGERTPDFLNYEIVNNLESFGDDFDFYWPGLVEMRKSTFEQSLIFDSIIKVFGENLKDYWPILTDLVVQSGRQTTWIHGGLLTVAQMIRSPADLKTIGSDLVYLSLRFPPSERRWWGPYESTIFVEGVPHALAVLGGSAESAWPIFMKLARLKGVNVNFFDRELADMLKALPINAKFDKIFYLPGLIEIIHNAYANGWPGWLSHRLQQMPELFKQPEYWPGTVALAQAAGAETLPVFEHLLPRLTRLVKNRRSYYSIRTVVKKIVRNSREGAAKAIFRNGIETAEKLLGRKIFESEDSFKRVSAALFKIANEYPAGESSVFSDLTDLNKIFDGELIQSVEDLELFGVGLARMAQANGSQFRNLFESKLKGLKRFSLEELRQHWDRLIQLSEAAGPHTAGLFQTDFVNVVETDDFEMLLSDLRFWKPQAVMGDLLRTWQESHLYGLDGLVREVIAGRLPVYVQYLSDVFVAGRFEPGLLRFLKDASIDLKIRMAIIPDYLSMLAIEKSVSQDSSEAFHKQELTRLVAEAKQVIDQELAAIPDKGSVSQKRKAQRKISERIKSLREEFLVYLLGRRLTAGEAELFEMPYFFKKIMTVVSIVSGFGEESAFGEKALTWELLRRALNTLFLSYDPGQPDAASLASAKLNAFVLNLDRPKLAEILTASVAGKEDRPYERSAEHKSNEEIRKELIAAGVSPELWDNGIDFPIELSSGLTEENKRKQISLAANEMIDIARELGLQKVGRVSLAAGETPVFTDYEKAQKFYDDVLASGVTVPQQKRTRFDQILLSVRSLESKPVVIDLEKRSFRVTIKKDFFEEATAGLGVPGCYFPTGVHGEMPLVHAFETNVFFIQVFFESNQVANAVVILDKEGSAYVYQGYNGSNYDMAPAFAAALVELARLVPKVYLVSSSAGYAELINYGQVVTGDVTLSKPGTVFRDQYYDHGSVDRQTGDLTLSLQDALLITKTPLDEKGMPRSSRVVTTQNQVPSPENAPLSPAIEWQSLANKFLNDSSLKPYVSIVGAIKNKTQTEGRQVIDNDFYDWIKAEMERRFRRPFEADETDRMADAVVDFLEEQNWPVEILTARSEVRRDNENSGQVSPEKTVILFDAAATSSEAVAAELAIQIEKGYSVGMYNVLPSSGIAKLLKSMNLPRSKIHYDTQNVNSIIEYYERTAPQVLTFVLYSGKQAATEIDRRVLNQLDGRAIHISGETEAGGLGVGLKNLGALLKDRPVDDIKRIGKSIGRATRASSTAMNALYQAQYAVVFARSA